MSNKKEKNLTPSALQKEIKKLNEVQKFAVRVGEEDYVLTHDIHFRKSKIQDLLDDVVDFFNYAGQERLDILNLATPYTTLLILKHFTSLNIPDEIDEAIDFLIALIDLEALDKIVLALPDDQISKVYEHLEKTVQNFKENMEEMEQEAQKMALENPEILKTDEDMVLEDGEQDTTEQE